MSSTGGEWASPGDETPVGQPDPRWPAPSSAEPPRFGERVPASAVAPAAYQPAWQPPAKPGLVPLHPLGFGQLLGIAFATVRWNPRATVLPALLITIVQSGILYGLTSLVAVPGLDRLSRASSADAGPIAAGLVAQGSGVALLSIAISVIGSAVLQAVVVPTVARGALGARPTAGAVLREGGRRLLPLVGFALLIAAAEVVAVLLLSLIVVLISLAGVVGVVLGVLTALVGIAGLAVLVAWITIKLCVVPSIIVLERRGVGAAMRRSWALTRGSFWRTLGLVLLISAIVAVATEVVAAPISVLGGAIAGILAPNASSADPLGAVVPGLLGGIPAAIVVVVVGGIGSIAQAAAVALVYLDLRMRREGLELDLQRAVDHPGTFDPFAPHP